MVEELMGAYGGRLVIAVLGVAVGLACLVGVLWLVRGRRGPSPFVRGGKNRQPRLQVLDAAAVDTRRRLVLVRRDDTEHLIMIGGPTDIVIETGISAGRAPAAVSTEESFTVSRPAEQAERPAAPPRAPAVATAHEPRREQPRPLPQPVEAAPRKPVAPPQPQAPQAPAVAARIPEPTIAYVANPIAPPVTVPPRTEPALDNAADILDAARMRVFQGPTVPVRTPPPDLLMPTGDGSKGLGSDFERVLEEEMANNLAAREAGSPPRPTGKPPITGTTAEPSLQSEVARIFGEMSVTREK